VTVFGDNASDSDLQVATALALATLGDATQIGSFLFLNASPKVAMAKKDDGIIADVFAVNFANVKMALAAQVLKL
jgi:hypothetical protein